jgi:hypothetical protein
MRIKERGPDRSLHFWIGRLAAQAGGCTGLGQDLDVFFSLHEESRKQR